MICWKTDAPAPHVIDRVRSARGLCVAGLLIALATCLPATAWSEEVDADVVQLFRLIDQRLAHMDEVAAYKWVHRLDIADLERENTVIVEAGRDAARFGLSRTTEGFFAAQIEAAKVIQAQWFAAWKEKREPFPAEIHDLVHEVRPHLSELGEEITARIALVLPQLRTTDRARLDELAAREIDVRYLDPRNRDTLLDTLLAITYDKRVDQTGAHLARIRASGHLRVGTTADYTPFSYLDAVTGEYHGIDVALARRIAASLNVDPMFVPTTWPTLSEDLAAGKFDVAMSGISRTTQRQTVGFFSLAYLTDGKTPISRCSEAARFSSLAAIDEPGVRVIVNPGGTNQQYVEANIHRATVRTFDDNRTIFNEIAEGRADVMITDAIEVALQSRRLPLLCPTMPDSTLTRSSKGVFMPWGVELKRAVDGEIAQLEESGQLTLIVAYELQRASQ